MWWRDLFSPFPYSIPLNRYSEKIRGNIFETVWNQAEKSHCASKIKFVGSSKRFRLLFRGRQKIVKADPYLSWEMFCHPPFCHLCTVKTNIYQSSLKWVVQKKKEFRSKVRSRQKIKTFKCRPVMCLNLTAACQKLQFKQRFTAKKYLGLMAKSLTKDSTAKIAVKK